MVHIHGFSLRDKSNTAFLKNHGRKPLEKKMAENH